MFGSYEGLLMAIRDGLTDEEADRALYFITSTRAAQIEDGRAFASDLFQEGDLTPDQAHGRMVSILDRAEAEGRATYFEPDRQRRRDTAGTWHQLNGLLKRNGLPRIHARYIRDNVYGGVMYLPKLADVLEDRRSRGPVLRLLWRKGDLDRFRALPRPSR